MNMQLTQLSLLGWLKKSLEWFKIVREQTLPEDEARSLPLWVCKGANKQQCLETVDMTINAHSSVMRATTSKRAPYQLISSFYLKLRIWSDFQIIKSCGSYQQSIWYLSLLFLNVQLLIIFAEIVKLSKGYKWIERLPDRCSQELWTRFKQSSAFSSSFFTTLLGQWEFLHISIKGSLPSYMQFTLTAHIKT